MLSINIEVMPHEYQRYETVGDWTYNEQLGQTELDIKVSKMNNEDYEFLVGIHELVEAYLCRKRGIKEEDVSAFDIAFESKRTEGNTDEPGDQIDAPYNKEHIFATKIERLIAAELNVNWEEYEKAIYVL